MSATKRKQYSKPTHVNKDLSERYPHDYIDDRIVKVSELLPHTKDASYLDIGCSNGTVTAHLANVIGTQRIYGIDVANIAQAKKKGIQAQEHDLNSDQKMPFKKNQFDIITCLDTLEHIYNTDHLIQEIERVLKPGGTAVISVPRTDSLVNIGLLLLGFQLFSGSSSLERNYGAFSNNRVSGHMAHFTKKALYEICQHHGLEVVEYAEASFAGAWLGDQQTVTGSVDWKKKLIATLIRMIPFKKEISIVAVRPTAT